MMYFASENKEERYLFSYEERKSALKRSGGICAHCGKKLTTKTMTMDHIVPISRGGTNEPENLIALCENCNKEKGNMLYMPSGFYLAMKNEGELHKIEKYVERWFQEVKDQFDISRYPMIAPQMYLQLQYSSNVQKKYQPYIPQMVYKWSIIGKETYAEIEAVTDINIKEVRTEVPKLYFNSPREDRIPTVALYSLRKETTDKILAVVAVHVIPDDKHITVHMPWCIIEKKWQGRFMYMFIYGLLKCVTQIAQYDIDTCIVSCPNYRNALDKFVNSTNVHDIIGKGFTYNQNTEIPKTSICIHRKDIFCVNK